MLLIVSGEGPSDIGSSNNGSCECGHSNFSPGPLAHHLFLEIEKSIGYSPLETGLIFWVSRTELARIYSDNKQLIRISFPGAKSSKEMLSYVRMAQAFGIKALQIEAREECQSIGVLFHDSDGTNADSIHRWSHMVDAVEKGFGLANYDRGVAMVPKPKQEAWFICGLKTDPYIGCEALENHSGNDASPNNLKKLLCDVLGKKVTTNDLIDIIQAKQVDWDRISMPSYIHFRDGLIKAIKNWQGRV